MSLCKVDGCDKPGRARGLCDAHYWRWRKHGDPLGGRTPEGEPARFLETVVIPYDGDECLIWPFQRNVKGYAIIATPGNKKAIVSRLVCKRVYGPPPTEEHVAAHGCGNGEGGCVTKRHLRWATSQENADDTVAHGRTTCGERSASARLTEADIKRMRGLEGTMTLAAIGEMFGVGAPHVCRIFKGEKWRDLGT